MRISDWSSDVCSSDLTEQEHRHRRGEPGLALRQAGIGRNAFDHPPVGVAKLHDEQEGADRRDDIDEQIGQHRFDPLLRSEEHTSELQSLMRNSYAVFCLKKKKKINTTQTNRSKEKNTNTINKIL